MGEGFELATACASQVHSCFKSADLLAQVLGQCSVLEGTATLACRPAARGAGYGAPARPAGVRCATLRAFSLQQQHLIELIRQRETEAALEFAQTQLAEQGEESRECLTEMERTLALLAFDNPEDSPFGDLLNMMQRQKVGCSRHPPGVQNGVRMARDRGTAFQACDTGVTAPVLP